MPLTFLETTTISLASGLIGGVLGPIINNKFISTWWKFTKRHELKYESFQSALKTIGKIEADILDIELQNKKESYKGITPFINFKSETRQCIENSKGLVKTWFSQEVYLLFEKVLKTNLSLENVPNDEHEKLKLDFIIKAAKEIKIGLGSPRTPNLNKPEPKRFFDFLPQKTRKSKIRN